MSVKKFRKVISIKRAIRTDNRLVLMIVSNELDLKKYYEIFQEVSNNKEFKSIEFGLVSLNEVIEAKDELGSFKKFPTILYLKNEKEIGRHTGPFEKGVIEEELRKYYEVKEV